MKIQHVFSKCLSCLRSCSVCQLLSCVRLFAIPQTITHQAPLSVEFSRQEYWSGFPFLLQGIFPTQGSTSGLPHCRQAFYHLRHMHRQIIELTGNGVYVYIKKNGGIDYRQKYREEDSVGFRPEMMKARIRAMGVKMKRMIQIES